MASNDVTSAFKDLAETDVWVDVGMLAAGFVGSDVAQSAIDGMMPRNIPNEAYGLAVAGGSIYMGYRKPALGAAAYSASEAASRFGLQSALMGGGE